MNNFSYEWDFYKESKETQEYHINRILDGFKVTPDFFKGKHVLEVGCGIGRQTVGLARWAKKVAAIDNSTAILKMPKIKNVKTKQTDLMEYNPKEKYDIVYSRGVLHHLESPYRAFLKCVDLAKSDGIIMFSLYPYRGELFFMINTFIRSITKRLPHKLLFRLCKMFASVVPIVHKLMYRRTNKRPISYNESVWLLFDWFSPKYQHHIKDDEIDNWTAGMKVLKEGKAWRIVQKNEVNKNGRNR